VTAGTIFQDTRTPLPVWFRAMWWVTTQKNGASALGLQRVLGLKKYETAWTWLHKLRRAMVRPGRELLTGRVEVDECYRGGLEEGLPGRLNLKKTLVVVAAQEDGPGIGRIRMRQISDASAESLMPFVRDSVEPGSVIHTDGWLGYSPLERNGYHHEVTFLKGKKKTPSELMPRVHRVISLLKRWLMGTHQGAVSHKHLGTIWMSSRSASTGGDQKAEASFSFASRNKPSRWAPSLMIGSSIRPPRPNHKP
jgi:transposase-like protein